MDEKIFYFYEQTSPENAKAVSVKESELSDAQKDFIVGNVIHQYDQLPKNLQKRFIEEIIGARNEARWREMSEETKEFMRKIFHF